MDCSPRQLGYLAAITMEQGVPGASLRRPSQCEPPLECLYGLLDELRGGEQLQAIAVGVPGPFDRETWSRIFGWNASRSSSGRSATSFATSGSESRGYCTAAATEGNRRETVLRWTATSRKPACS